MANREESFEDIIKILDKDVASSSEVATLIFSLIEETKNVVSNLEQEAKANKRELDKHISKSIGDALERMEGIAKDLEERIKRSDRNVNGELDKLAKEVFLELGKVRDAIPVVDFSGIIDRLVEIEGKIPKIPEELKAEQIRDKLESLEDEERLDASAIKNLPKAIEQKILAGGPHYLAGENISIEGNVISSTGGGTPASPDTSVQFNDGGSFGGSVNFTYDSSAGGSFILTQTGDSVANPTTAGEVGGQQISAGILTVTSNGDVSTPSVINVNGAFIEDDGDFLARGGNLNLAAGSFSGLVDSTDYDDIRGGQSGFNGGSVTDGTGSGTGANIFANGGGFDGSEWFGGELVLTGGNADPVGGGGNATIAGGSGGSTSGSGGSISLTAGSAQGGDSDGGDLTLSAGQGKGEGVGGDVVISAGYNNDGEPAVYGNVYLNVGFDDNSDKGQFFLGVNGQNHTNETAILNISSITTVKTFTFPDVTGVFSVFNSSNQLLNVGDAAFDTFLDFSGLSTGRNYAFPDTTGTLAVVTAGGAIIASGVYTPTRSSETNLDANVTMSEAQYMRVGNTVTVSGRFTADPTTPAAATNFEMTLPIASNIGAIEDLAGVAFCGAIAGMGAAIHGVVANDTAEVAWVASDVTSQTWSYTFSYQII